MAESLAGAGVDTVFSLLGEGVLWLADTLTTNFDVELVPAWSDNLALAMADGYARSTSRVGVAALTLGPGLTSAMTSLVVAHKHGTPLLLIVGAPASVPGYHNQRIPQRALVEAAGVEYVEIANPNTAASVTTECLWKAQAQRRPVVLAVPADLQRADVDITRLAQVGVAHVGVAHGVRREPVVPTPDDLDRLAAILAAAERPLLIAGAGAVGSNALAQIERLAELTGSLLGTSLRALGGFADHPAAVGVVGGFADDDVRELLRSADLVVAFGARFGHYTSSWGEIAPTAAIVRVLDHEPPEIDGMPRQGIVVVGDVAMVATHLTHHPWPPSDRQGWVPPEPRDWTKSEPSGLHSYSATRLLSASLAPKARLVLGVGHFWSIVATELREIPPSRLVFEDDFTAIGQALAMACGVSLGNPGEPTYVVDGDGSLLFNPSALRTVSELDLPICIVTLNDGAYSAEVHALESDGRSGDIARYTPFAFTNLARSYGIEGIQCETLADLQDGLERFMSERKAVLLDVRVTPTVVSRTYRRTRYGERV